MDQQLIKALIDALAASDLSELEYSRDGAMLRLVKHPPGASVPSEPAPPPPRHLPQPAPGAEDAIVAPLYGIVHLQRSPGSPPLVSAGQRVSAGQALCVIEAMKVFNELRAERDATIAAVLVETGQEVEAGQPLFRLG